MGDPTLLFVFLAGLFTCLATGLGALPLIRVPNGGDRIMAFALVLVPRGASVPAAAAWSITSSVPQPLLSVPAFAH